MKYCVSTKDFDNLHWISMIVNVICEILLKSNDVQIIQKGTSLLRFYVPMCKEIIESKKQQPMIGNVINSIFNNTDLLESGLVYMGNLTVQYFYHLQKKIELSILEMVVKRIYRVSFLLKIVQNAFDCPIHGSHLQQASHSISD